MSTEQQPPPQQVHWNDHPSGPLPAPAGYLPPGPPPPMGPPPYGYYGGGGYYPMPMAPVVPTSGLAVSSLVWSLVGLVTLGLGAVGGVICGHMALGETRNGSRGGHGLAIAGLIIGWIQCGGWLLFWGFMLFGGFLSALGR